MEESPPAAGVFTSDTKEAAAGKEALKGGLQLDKVTPVVAG